MIAEDFIEQFLNLIWESQNTSILAKIIKKLGFLLRLKRLSMLSNYMVSQLSTPGTRKQNGISERRN